jgi:hypothetical protein
MLLLVYQRSRTATASVSALRSNIGIAGRQRQ